MKRSAIAAAVLALGAVFGACDVAQAAVSVSVFVDPGVYGRVAIGGYAEPPQVYADAPVMVDEDGNLVSVVGPEDDAADGGDDEAGWAPTYPEPVFLWVPEYQRLHWARYCDLYGARGVPVYFVQDGWYRDNVMRRRWTPVQRGWSSAQWREQDRLARLHWEHERWEHERWEHAHWDHDRDGHAIVGVRPEWPGSPTRDPRPQPWAARDGGWHDGREGAWHDGRDGGWHGAPSGNGWQGGQWANGGRDGRDGQPRAPGVQPPHDAQGWNHRAGPGDAQARGPQPSTPGWPAQQVERRYPQPARGDDRGRAPDAVRGGPMPVASWQPVARPPQPAAPAVAPDRNAGRAPDHGDRGEGRDGGGHRMRDR